MVAPPDNDVLWARSLHCSLGGFPALSGVSLGVREGGILAVCGPRGSGKSTLLRCLSGQLVPQEGEVWFDGHQIDTLSAARRERLRAGSFAWVGPEPSLVPELNGWENAALPLLLRGTTHRAARAAATEWLERLDIGDCARSRPAALPQDKRQRIAVARALTAAPAVLFADEPTAALHAGDRAHVLRTLTTAARSHGITVVLSGADDETASLADLTVRLLDGRRADTPSTDGEGQEACSLSV
ncbi:ABC transporter ATP-binding protein [Streptomyces fuscigenes]|uniref:ABC transporter ATP-binding protein n=1 Tax=Streptomyces fuscigenes TaxID=1528880 RepID=UPI001F3571EE|nr:ATP-binding cassette domain-containing protein [Streptomyces fuscigenes]MCF3965473.1 ATP-binding cassette domain-containing protein [Streptomyces fuscigenes]